MRQHSAEYKESENYREYGLPISSRPIRTITDFCRFPYLQQADRLDCSGADLS